MTAPRIVVAGATMALTRRTVSRRAYLAPWHPLVEDIWLYALAYAAWKHDVAVHHGVLMVNHDHLTVTPRRANLPAFMQLFRRDVSCGLNALLEEEGYEPPGQVFDGRQAHAMRLLDAEAQMSHLVYERLNPVAAGLVARPEDMPGAVLDLGRWCGGALEVRRPPVYFGRSRPEALPLPVEVTPLVYRQFGGDTRAAVYALEQLEKDGARAIRAARGGRPVRGAEALRHIHPYDEPQTPREPRGQPVPTFRIGARGILGRTLHVQAAGEVKGWRKGYRGSLRDYREQVATPEPFPYGTYEMARFHHAPVADAPPPGALVCAPGPLLDDVKDELAQLAAPQRDALRAARHHAQREVAAAFAHEASQLVAHAQAASAGDPGASLVPHVTCPPEAGAEPEGGDEAEPAPDLAADEPEPPSRDGARPRRSNAAPPPESAPVPDPTHEAIPPPKHGAPDAPHGLGPRAPRPPGQSRHAIPRHGDPSRPQPRCRHRGRHGSDPPD